MRIGLKLAILQAGKTQRQVGIEAGIPENRLSELVRGWSIPRPEERTALERVLGRPESELFAQTPEADLRTRGVLDGLQAAIVSAQPLGCDDLMDALLRVKQDAQRLFARQLEATDEGAR